MTDADPKYLHTPARPQGSQRLWGKSPSEWTCRQVNSLEISMRIWNINAQKIIWEDEAR